MQLTYRPEGKEPTVWPFEPQKLLSSEAIALEKVTGFTYEEFGQQVLRGSMLARRALLWVYLKRGEPTLRFDQLDPPVEAIELSFDPDELTKIRDEVFKNQDLTDSERYQALEEIDRQLSEVQVEAPKVPAENVNEPST